MGSMPRLKIKDEIRYRKGSTNEAQNCRHCANYKEQYALKRPIIEGRCKIIGIKESIRYRVLPGNTCDRQQMSEDYKRKIEGMINGD